MSQQVRAVVARSKGAAGLPLETINLPGPGPG